jgi:hypothetical protein
MPPSDEQQRSVRLRRPTPESAQGSRSGAPIDPRQTARRRVNTSPTERAVRPVERPKQGLSGWLGFGGRPGGDGRRDDR